MRCLSIFAILSGLSFVACAVQSTSVVKDTTDVGLGVKIWNCDADSDPDTLSIDIYEKNSQLIALLGEETGDGDNYDFDAISLSVASTANGQITFRQLGDERPGLPNVSGRTQGFRFDLNTGTRTGEAVMTSGPAGNEAVYAMSCAVGNGKPLLAELVDLRTDFGDRTVTFKGYRALILVADQGSAPSAVFQVGVLCNRPGLGEFRLTDAGEWALVIAPEFEMDDGLNACKYVIEQPSGAHAVISLQIHVSN